MSLSPRAALGLALAICATSAACDAVDGTDPYALWRVHEHPTGAFHFHALEPPWEVADGSTAEHPVLLLEPDTVPAGDSGDPGAAVRLEAFIAEAADVSSEAAARASAWQGAGYAVDAAVELDNRAGDVGLVVRASNGELNAVDVAFSSGTGAAVLSLWGDRDLDDADFDLLIAGFEPRASEAHE